MKLYFYTAAPQYAATTTADLANIVTAFADPTTDANAAILDRVSGKIPELVQSDTGDPLEFYFYDDASNLASWSTDANVTVAVAIGDLDPLLQKTYAVVSPLTVSSNARVATFDLNTTELSQKLATVRAQQIGPFVRPPRTTLTLQVRKTTGGVTKTVAMIPVGVSAGVLSASPAPMSELVYTATVPATSTSTGASGQWSYDADYFYLAVSANTWRRFPLNDWA